MRTGCLDDMEPSAFPASYMIAPPWKERLESAPSNAAVCYHLGVIEHCAGNLERARVLFERSLAYRPSAAAHRAMARLNQLEDQKEACLAQYRQSLRLAGAMPELEMEYAQTLLAFERYDALLAFEEGLPQALRELPRFLYLRASALAEVGRFDEAEEILLRPLVVPDMREGELSLSDLWFRIYMKKEKLTRQQAEERHPLPESLDFRMH